VRAVRTTSAARVALDVTAGDPYRAHQCGGCGAALQSAHPRQPGYLPPPPPAPAPAPARALALAPAPARPGKDDSDDWEVAAAFNTYGSAPPPAPSPGGVRSRRSGDDADVALPPPAVCQRCHSLTHYGRVRPVDVAPAAFRQQLLRWRTVPALVVVVVDVTDVPGSVLPDAAALLGPQSSAVVVGHKVDLLPPDARRPRVRQWLQRQLRAHAPALMQRSAHADPAPLVKSKDDDDDDDEEEEEEEEEDGRVPVHLASGHTGEGVPELLALLQRKRRGRDVVLVGCANVGKSRLINALLDRYAPIHSGGCMVCVCMRVCMYVCVYACMYVGMYVYMYT
jgi:hypothetical protein